MTKMTVLVAATLLFFKTAELSLGAVRTVTVIAVEAGGMDSSTVAPLSNAKVLVQLESGNVHTGFTDAAGRTMIRFPEESTYVVRVIFGPGVIKFTNRLYGRADQVVSVYNGPEPAQALELTDLDVLLMSIDEIAEGVDQGIPIGLREQFQSKEVDQALQVAKKDLPSEEYELYLKKLQAIREAKSFDISVPESRIESQQANRCILKRLFRRR